VAAGDPLDPGGRAANLAPATRAEIVNSYGRWLNWLRGTGDIDTSVHPASRITPEAVAAYVEELGQLNAPQTVLCRVRSLACAVDVMWPSTPTDWLWAIVRRLKRKAQPLAGKRDRLVQSGALIDLGRRLMAEAESSSEGSASRRAARYRDGLLIAILAARPVRLRNLAGIEVGQHLVRIGADYVLLFAASETKTKVALEYALPPSLTPFIDRYLDYYRLVLREYHRKGRNRASNTPAGRYLWVSTEGSAMTAVAIYDRVVKHTAERLGRRVNPHAFRHCAASSVALLDPGHLLINKSVLGHTTIATSERYYTQARAAEASITYQEWLLSRTLAAPPRKQGRG
jgi:integrase